jgi:hypothetical protein
MDLWAAIWQVLTVSQVFGKKWPDCFSPFSSTKTDGIIWTICWEAKVAGMEVDRCWQWAVSQITRANHHKLISTCLCHQWSISCFQQALQTSLASAFTESGSIMAITWKNNCTYRKYSWAYWLWQKHPQRSMARLK